MMYLKAKLYEAFVKYAISIKEKNPTKPHIQNLLQELFKAIL